MDRRITKASKTKSNPVNTRKITIKRVTSLPKDKKHDLYNPFSCVSDEISPQLSPSNEEETKIYDPFEPTESDEEKQSPQEFDCNPEKPEEIPEDTNKEEIAPAEKIEDQFLEASQKDSDAKIVDRKKGMSSSTLSVSSEKGKRQKISEDIFKDLEDNKHDSLVITKSDKTIEEREVVEMIEEPKEVNMKHEDKTDESEEGRLQVNDTIVEQPIKSDSHNKKVSVSATDDQLDVTSPSRASPMEDHIELHPHSSEFSSKQKKHKKHSKHHKEAAIASKIDSDNSAEMKTVKNAESRPRRHEKKAKHQKKDHKKETRKSIDSDNIYEITEEIEVTEQEDEEEGEIVDARKIIPKKLTPKPSKKEHKLKAKSRESDSELVEVPRREKKIHKDSSTEESKPKHKKNKRKNSDYKDEKMTKEERKPEKPYKKRKSTSHERKEVGDEKKQKSNHTLDREKSVEYGHRGLKRRSTTSDRELDSHGKVSKEREDYKKSHSDSRHREKKADRERDSQDERKYKNKNDTYRDTHRRSSGHDERKEKEREPLHQRKNIDKYHRDEMRERRSKQQDEFSDEFSNRRDSKGRKSPSVERHRKRQRDNRVSKSSDRDAQKRKQDKTSSAESNTDSKLIAKSSSDASHKRRSSHKSKPVESEVTWKRKERERTISWRSVDDNVYDPEINKKHSHHSSSRKEAKLGHHDRVDEFERDKKSKRRKLSHSDDSYEHSTVNDSSKHPKKTKRKHKRLKNKLSPPSSMDELDRPEKKSSKYKKKKKKRQSSVESANSSRRASEMKTGNESRISSDEFSNNDSKTDRNNHRPNSEVIRNSSVESQNPTFYEDLDVIDSTSPLPNSNRASFHEESKQDVIEEDDNCATSPLDISMSPSKDLHLESPLLNDGTPTLVERSSRSPLQSAKEDVKPHQNIKESLSFAEEFLERSRKRWKEKKSSVASSNDSPQLCVLSDSESKSNHRNLADTENDTYKNNESNGNGTLSSAIELPGLGLMKSPVCDTDFRFHSFGSRSRDVEVDIFEDSHQGAGTPHHPADNGLSDGAVSTKRSFDSREANEHEISPADMVLDSGNSDGVDVADKDSLRLSAKEHGEKDTSDNKNDDKLSNSNGETALLNPTQILNSIGLNPQQHSAAQNAILSIAELSKHLHLDKFSDHLLRKTQKGKTDTPGDIESSAVELHNKDKKRGHLKKLKFQEQVIEEAKSAIKPYYESRQISKSEYKDILKKAVNKIYSSETAHEVNTVKIRRLIRRYIEKYQQKKSIKRDKNKPKASKSPLAPEYQPLTSTTETKTNLSYPLPFSKREAKKSYTLPDLPLPPPPPPPKR